MRSVRENHRLLIEHRARDEAIWIQREAAFDAPGEGPVQREEDEAPVLRLDQSAARAHDRRDAIRGPALHSAENGPGGRVHELRSIFPGDHDPRAVRRHMGATRLERGMLPREGTVFP